MKTTLTSKGNAAGYTLMMVMLFTGVGLIILTSVMAWTSSNATLTARNNEDFISVSAAEAATEKVLAYMARDYKSGGYARIEQNRNSYSDLKPLPGELPTLPGENSFWSDYDFITSKDYVQRTVPTNYMSLESQYTGLMGFASKYKIISNAQKKNSLYKIRAAVQQEVQLASIPIFQFAVFYDGDLEVNPGEPMNIKGRVHSNGNIWNGGGDTLTYWNGVTAVGRITETRHPSDPQGLGGEGKVIYKEEHLKKTNELTITLPIGSLTNNLNDIIKPPLPGEARTSELGVQRYYNKAELIILVKDNGITVSAQDPITGAANKITTSVSSFITTNKTFYDQRENKTIKTTEIDVAKLGDWSKSNAVVQNTLPGALAIPVNLVYVADQRTSTSSHLPAVRLINGKTLPERGMTIATENPLYVLDHFNAPSNLGKEDTSKTKPASLISDALTVLSSAWDDDNGKKSYTSRKAKDTTVNAAILTGIVRTTNSPSRYSGGVQNVARFLEDWKDKTLTYNGSIVVLFDSVKATSKFEQPGDYYAIPDRNFSFDNNFTSQAKLPPGTPELRTLIRAGWATIPPNTTDYVKTF